MIMPNALVVATDSRFTLLDGHHDDGGRKLYPFPPSSSLLYTGDVMAAEDAYNTIAKLCTERQLNYTEFVRVLQVHLQAAYSSEKRRRSDQNLEPPGPLHMLFAACDGYGRGYIVKFSSITGDFRPVPVGDLEVLGHPIDVALFQKHFDDEEAWRRSQNSSISGPPEVYATIAPQILGPMKMVIDDPRQSSGVGGRLQALVISKDGITSYEIHQAGAPKTVDGPPTVDQITTPLSGVRQYRPRVKYPPRASSEPDIVSVHILD